MNVSMNLAGGGAWWRQSLLVAVVALAPQIALAADPLYTGLFSNTFLQGHDPVAYFTEGRPVKGRKDITTEYEGVEIRFASQSHKDDFLADPTAFLPQYGGYCAWAVAQNKTAKGDARYWKIVDGKLYLNYSQKIQTTWEEDVPGFIEQANGHWPSVLN